MVSLSASYTVRPIILVQPLHSVGQWTELKRLLNPSCIFEGYFQVVDKFKLNKFRWSLKSLLVRRLIKHAHVISLQL